MMSCGAGAERLLRSGKAREARNEPSGIQLLYDCAGYTKPIALGAAVNRYSELVLNAPPIQALKTLPKNSPPPASLQQSRSIKARRLAFSVYRKQNSETALNVYRFSSNVSFLELYYPLSGAKCRFSILHSLYNRAPKKVI
jgi:hypothetical protein